MPGRRLLYGPPPPLPGRVDRVLDGWARLPPRVRLLAASLVVVVATVQCSAWRDGLTDRWGGEGVEVLLATRALAPGQLPPDAVTVQLVPPLLAPPDAVTQLDDDSRLVLPLPEGAVLTHSHLSPVGLAAALPADERALAVPVADSLGVEPGSSIDLWVLQPDRGPPSPLARGRPVLAVTEDRGRRSAVISLPVEVVAAATGGLATGGLVVTLAPSATTAPR